MIIITVDEYISLLDPGTLQCNHFKILQDEKWHCRKCAQQLGGSEQLAGDGGVQGL